MCCFADRGIAGPFRRSTSITANRTCDTRLQQPFVSIGSDGTAVKTEGPLARAIRIPAITEHFRACWAGMSATRKFSPWKRRFAK